MNHIVYKITNTINNKIYIGVHSTSNPQDDYFGSGISIKRAIKKYGNQNFTKEILFDYDNSKEAYLIEFLIVDEKFIKRKDTYNIAPGGRGGQKYTMSYEQKRKLSLIMSGNKNPFYGKYHTKETKQLIGESSKGRNVDRTMPMNQKEKLTGKKNYQYTSDYITPWGKFDTIKSASTYIFNGVSSGTIYKWCKTNNNNVISNLTISVSPYLQFLKSFDINLVGKSFNDIGFGMENDNA